MSSVKRAMFTIQIILLIFLLFSTSGSTTTHNFAKKHRVLMVEIPRTTSEYSITLPEDAFLAGAMVEICGYDSFVVNADKWKSKFDIFVLNSPNQISYQSKCTPAELKNAIQKFMDAGVFLLWFKPENDLNLHKYGANGSIDSSLDADMSTLLSGLTRTSKNFSKGTGAFLYGATYPFSSTKLLRSVNGVVCKPTNRYLSHFTSTDPETIFPIIAVQDDIAANCTAYKPGKFFIIANGGYEGDNIDQKAYYKYIDGSELLRLILGKKNNIRLSQDAINGRRITAIGVDCDVTNEMDSITPLVGAFSGKPLEFGLVASKVTDDLASKWKSYTKYIVSHTNDHFNLLNKITVTAEVHKVDNNQLVTLNRPFRAAILEVKSQDGLKTYKLNGTTINTAKPGTAEYAINQDTNYNTYSIDGVLKFNSAAIGTSVKITYTCDDEYLQSLGSIEKLKEKGCLSDKVLYQTGGFYSVQPKTYALAEESGTTLCAYNTYPGYSSAWQIEKGVGKGPIPMGIIAKPWYNSSFEDVEFFKYSKLDNKHSIIPAVLERCEKMELPILFYIHDFPFSSTDKNSLWVSSLYNADWKKSTLSETRAYAQELYTWMVSQFDSINTYWMPRGEYVERFYYMNKYLEYDVTEEPGITTVIIKNTGNKLVKGITFRIPVIATPKSVKLGNASNCDHTYVSNLVTAWFDLKASSSETLVVNY